MLNNAVRTIDPQRARQWLADGEAILIDVREPDEFRAEHIPYAASLPLAAVGRLGRDLDIPAGKKLIFQCLSGGRAGQACALVSGAFPDRDIYNLAGGIGAWKSAGLPLVRSGTGSSSFPSLFRQVQIVVGSLVVLCVALGFIGYRPAFALAGVIGAMLAIAGVTGWCGMAMLLARMPWNKGGSVS